ncbi:hypothetical protein D3C86_2249000 [compost metagenome]
MVTRAGLALVNRKSPTGANAKSDDFFFWLRMISFVPSAESIVTGTFGDRFASCG